MPRPAAGWREQTGVEVHVVHQEVQAKDRAGLGHYTEGPGAGKVSDSIFQLVSPFQPMDINDEFIVKKRHRSMMQIKVLGLICT